jgi:hypothetical protein
MLDWKQKIDQSLIWFCLITSSLTLNLIWFSFQIWSLFFFILLLINFFFQFNPWEFDFNLFLCQIWSMFFLLLFALFWIPFFLFFSNLILYYFFSWEIFFVVFSPSIGLVSTSCSRSWVSKVNTGCLQFFL